MSDGDSALDYDSTATVTGGTVVAAGYSGMAQNFGANSTQGSILLTCQSASTETIRVTDASGNVLAEGLYLRRREHSGAHAGQHLHRHHGRPEH